MMIEDSKARPFDASDVETVDVLGVGIANLSQTEAVVAMKQLIDCDDDVSRGLFIVNAHTLNLAHENPAYRDVLNGGSMVFGDGTGVRWAARHKGVQMRANLVGTDLLPTLLCATAGLGYRYFLLGSTEETIANAARTAKYLFPGWTLAGYHHGYVIDDSRRAIEEINAAKPHLLMVGMGNPLQEQWIHDHLDELRVPLSVGVGGLFDHWGGNLKRAPLWVRRLGVEWLQILLQQPQQKWRRYIIGNGQFLARIARDGAASASAHTANA
jgi:N-acetylglucosaminyldiphosphoundecaprenol N-acetyl-beta-D-mannosaminyltransferase